MVVNGINVALNKPAFMSSASNASVAAKFAVDGLPATMVQCNETNGCWFYLDLGAAHELADIELIRVINLESYQWRLNCYELVLKDATNATTFRQQMSGGQKLNYVLMPQPPLPGCERSGRSPAQRAWYCSCSV